MVIVGAGFGGLSAARALADAPVDVLVIDKRNHHLFQPLLYQIATAGLSPADIAAPIRGVLSKQKNATVVLGEVTGIDLGKREVIGHNEVRDGRVHFDYLILATGARHAYFGHDDWERYAPGLKTVEDATSIRHRLLIAFEQAEMADNEDERRRLLTIAIIGAGPTGVEMAGAVAELARASLAADFRRIDPRQTRIVLIEAGPRVLATFPESLSAAAAHSLQKLGVEVQLGKAVTRCDEDGVQIGEERIDASTIVWAAGVQASPAAHWLGADADRAGRVKVQSDFSLPGQPDIFVIGDTATLSDAAGRLIPGVAPAAKQAGRHVAKVIRARVTGKPSPTPFRYFNWGNLATIGRRAAVVDFGWLRLRGPIAWWFWGLVHIFFLIDFRNRIAVMFNWAWSFVTFKRGARLITGNVERHD